MSCIELLFSFVHVDMCVLVRAHMWKLVVDNGCLPQFLSISFVRFLIWDLSLNMELGWPANEL